ncbi:tubulin-specific chaperone E-like isoform X2 [Penaeus chinensis]|uniref:tubulin-specific chaperone E-like isoform X2 n=1 Tax=Penaeus chinensis TaxID=139456 RepID=UPI001FB7DEFB|nr:tubulin-specific chaperone E-like isoform X2 [Penaeus chinensis]
MAGVAVDVGNRVECDGALGTVKWIGEVPGTQGMWYGVDWDDENRGKHDGTHNGIKYFETQYPKSGSFVRPTKVSSGMTLEAAVRGRYQDDPTIETHVTDMLQKTINARFVEVVGMEKIGKKQSKLEELETVVLDGWMVWGAGNSDLAKLLPRLQDLDISNTLLSSWESIAQITRQLPSLRFLNISGNKLKLPNNPDELQESVCHITHLVLNNMKGYTWSDLMTCCVMFPTLRKLQVAFNKLCKLGPVPVGLFDSLEEIDIGVNPICSWEEVCHLGTIPRLESLNVNNCQLKKVVFPSVPVHEKTKLFPNLKNLMIANNPLEAWESVGELNKLQNIKDLVISYDENITLYFQEFAFARISNLKVLNRTRLTPKEKRDCELFYLKSFSEDYYSSGGTEDTSASHLSQEFTLKHPTYLKLVEEYGAPVDETKHRSQKSQKLRDLKIELKIITPDDAEREPIVKSFLPTTKISKVKMMLKRQLKINPAAHINLSYCPTKSATVFEIRMDNDMKEMDFYSIVSGDTLMVRWE